jgi:D-sedoheptulose 7-phosphate isomerase
VANFHCGGRLFLAGSGPFGTIASLLGQTFLHRQTIERPALPAIALTNDAGLATFLAADNKSSQIFSRQLRAMATAQDTLMVLAGSETSAADLDVLETARQLGCKTVLIAGGQANLSGNPPDLSLQLPTDSLPRLLEGSLLVGNLLCSLIEGELFGI